MASREGRGAWEDLHSASRVLLFESSSVCGYIHTVCRGDAAENRFGCDCKEKSLLLYSYKWRTSHPWAQGCCLQGPTHSSQTLLTVIYRFQTLKLTIGPKLVLVGNLTTSLVPINLITTSFENEYKRRSAAFWGRVQDTPTGRCVHRVGGQGGRSKWCVRCNKHGGAKECHFLLTSWRHHDSDGKMVQRVSKCVGRVHKTIKVSVVSQVIHLQ